ncbi:synaptobrevin-1-like [Plodia interpunctella]|uniref:synaptobrevin-1-like n=1 Tax=Plodia interpunctella TaxID=58824 RepID=UPI002368739C|nr:synaptobrevin-1-like [Plodia interpunctella]
MEDQSGSSAPRVSDKRLAQTQAQVDEVVGIMRVNVEKVLERDQKLSDLDNRADALQHGAAQFEQQAGKLKKKMWWQNFKMMLIIGAIGGIVLIIIIVWAISGSGSNSNANAAPVTEAPAANTGR